MLTIDWVRIDSAPCLEQTRERERKRTRPKRPLAVTCRDLAVFHVPMVLVTPPRLEVTGKIAIMESVWPPLFQGAEMARRTCGTPLRLSNGKAFPEHLVIMVNGITGNASNWRYAADQFVKKLPDEVVVHCSQCNSSTRTFDGVDQMGNRLAEEVKKVVENKPGVKRISFVSHSLGGLVARYAIGVLYEPPSGSSTEAQNNCDRIDGNFNQNAEESKGKIVGLEPVSFITFATPHLGSRGNKQLPFVCGLPLLEKAASHSAHLFVGRTGRHLFLTDGKPPLLRRMVTDCGDLYFMSALRAFKRRVAYSNVSYDHMVGWRTASIRRQCELPKLQKVPVNEKYPHIINVEIGNDGNSIPRVAASKGDHTTDAVEEEMIAALNQVPWERVDVSFHTTKQRLFAHSTIQGWSCLVLDTHISISSVSYVLVSGDLD